jgi:hypothetical protein
VHRVYGAVARTIFSFCRLFFLLPSMPSESIKTWQKEDSSFAAATPLNALDPLQHPLTIHPINQHEASFYVGPLEGGRLLIFIKSAANQAGPVSQPLGSCAKNHAELSVLSIITSLTP